MTKSDEDFWRRFDELDYRRIGQLRRRESALRQLSPTSASSRDPAAIEAWREYCESVDQLEQSIAELERLIWDIK